MLNIKLSYIVTHITLTLGGLLVLVHVAVATERLEVKQDAEFPNKLFVKLTYSASEEPNAGSITDADYQSNCFCRAGHNTPLYNCATSLNYEKIVNITWSGRRNTIVSRKPDCSSDSRYSFNVTTSNIQVGLARNENGDELNVTLVCVDTFNHIYVNDESQQSDRIRLEFSKQSGNDNIILRFLRSEKQLVSSVVNRIWSYFSPSTDNNNGLRFNCGDAIITTTSSAQSDSTVHVNPTPETTISSSTKPTTTSTTTPNTNPVPETTITSTTKPTTTSTTNPNTNHARETTISSMTKPTTTSTTTSNTNHAPENTIGSTTKPAITASTTTDEQDLILMVVIPVVAVAVIIIVIIIVVVICVRRKRKLSAPAVQYHIQPTDPNYNRRSAFDEESNYNILGERVPVHCDEDDYDCPYSQNTKPRKLPLKTQPEGSTYEDVDHLDLKDQLDSSPGSNSSTKTSHQPDPSQLYSVVQKDRKTEDDQGIIMIENDLYE